MEDSTPPKAKIRKPFRVARVRRPAQADAPGEPPGDSIAVDGGRSEAPEPVATAPAGEPAAAATVDPAAAGSSDAGPEGRRGPRPPRSKGLRRQGHGGQRGGRPPRPPREPGADGAEPRGPIDPDAQPRFNNDRPPRQNDPNRAFGQAERKGKSRFGGQGGQGGQGGRGGQPRAGQGGQPPWAGKPNPSPYPGNGFDRGGEARRSRGLGPQHEEPVRLATLMVDRGLCSRHEAESYIERGWVIVNGERTSSQAMRVHPAAEIRLAPEARGEQSRRVTILFNKPVGYVFGAPESEAGPDSTAIGPHIGPDTLDVRYDGPSFHPSHLKTLAPAGSLDVDATGLMVLTQDERVTRQLTGEESELENEYLVSIDGGLSEEGLGLLNHGLELDGEALKPATVSRQNDGQLKFVLTAGRQGQIGRMCELVGVKAVDLKRVRIGHVRLGDLPQGKWRYLRDDENF